VGVGLVWLQVYKYLYFNELSAVESVDIKTWVFFETPFSLERRETAFSVLSICFKMEILGVRFSDINGWKVMLEILHVLYKFVPCNVEYFFDLNAHLL